MHFRDDLQKRKSKIEKCNLGIANYSAPTVIPRMQEAVIDEIYDSGHPSRGSWRLQTFRRKLQILIFLKSRSEYFQPIFATESIIQNLVNQELEALLKP